MSKLITDELIDERLDWNEDAEYTEKCDIVLEHYEVELTSEWKGNADYYIYSETTADGYEVWVATHDDRSINVNENVHYYDNDLGQYLKEAIPDYGVSLIQCEGWDSDEYWIQDAIDELYEDVYEEKKDELIEELQDEGYEFPKKETTKA